MYGESHEGDDISLNQVRAFQAGDLSDFPVTTLMTDTVLRHVLTVPMFVIGSGALSMRSTASASFRLSG